MTTVEHQLEAESEGTEPRVVWRRDLVTALLSIWLVAGAFLDGWAHGNPDLTESFTTPWHAVFYSGFAAVSGWVVWTAYRHRLRGSERGALIPAGYGLALAGIVVFLTGGVADLVWHRAFGIETGIAALLSPSHLLLFLGTALIVSTPLRSAWHRGSGRSLAFGGFLPILLSVSLIGAISAFMFSYLSPFFQLRLSDAEEATIRRLFEGAELWQANLVLFYSLLAGVASIIIWNALLFAPLLLMMSRWAPPPGTISFYFSFITIVYMAMLSFRNLFLVPAVVVGAIVLDLFWLALRRSTSHVKSHRIFALVGPVAFWSLYVVSVYLAWGLWWEPEFVGGTVIWTGLMGLGLSVLLLHPRGATLID